ncbi:MAG: SPOR domain-containing protein, partial [Desulfovibrio sp.]|nr:SPOR domain-containing protein [Desulfovibrio sp.]
DYVFQMGAFRDEDSVDSLRQRLEGRGLRTRMQREGKLYVVLVLLRGDPARAEEVARIAEELRLGKPLLKSRKSVQP